MKDRSQKEERYADPCPRPHRIAVLGRSLASDVEGSRKFYCDVFGWEAGEPSADFGGYFMFTRDGVPVAGAMGGLAANDAWKVYLATDDLAETLQVAEANGAQIIAPAMAVADLGTQAVLIDPTGAQVGAWEPAAFTGFTALDEPGAPSWFELQTPQHSTAVAFYRSAFRWHTNVVADTDEFRYTTMREPGCDVDLAGIMDVAAFPPDAACQWSIYWEVDDVDATIEKVRALGGSVVVESQDTPYGRMAAVTDPVGAAFKLRTAP